MRPKLIASTCQLLLLLCKAEQSEARVAIKFRRLEQMLRTRAGWNAKESRAFEHVCLEKKRSKYSGQVTEVGLWNVEGACVSPPGPTFLAIHIHQLAVQIVPLSVQIIVVMFGKKTVRCPSGLPYSAKSL